MSRCVAPARGQRARGGRAGESAPRFVHGATVIEMITSTVPAFLAALAALVTLEAALSFLAGPIDIRATWVDEEEERDYHHGCTPAAFASNAACGVQPLSPQAAFGRPRNALYSLCHSSCSMGPRPLRPKA